MAGTVENRPEDKNLLDKFIDLECFVRQQAVIADRSAEPSERNEQDAPDQQPSGWEEGKESSPTSVKRVNKDEVSKHAFFAVDWLPEWAFPRPRFLCGD